MLRKTANGIIDSLRENTLAIRETQQPRPRQQEQEVRYEPKVETTSSSEYTDNISEAVEQEYVAPPKRKKPATNLDSQVEFFEPEEVENGVYSILNDNGGFKTESKLADNMPKFGDQDILAGIEKIAKDSDLEKPVRKKTATKRATTKRATSPRKPRK
jgi:hypothetical protein